MTEIFKVEFYRDNSLSLDATDETLNFEVEEVCTSEKGMARLKLDGASIRPGDIKAGDAVVVEIASSGTVTTRVFAGEVDDVNFVREEGEPLVEITAYDWGKLLSERKVNLSYPTVEYVSTIAKDIVSSITSTITPGENERKITVNNVQVIPKTRTIDFIGLTMFEALQKLSDTALTDFYVDPNKDLHFFLRASQDSNKTLTENDLVNYEVRKEREVVNDCIVYGADNKTEPRYGPNGEDSWCESLTYWDSEAASGGKTITITGAPNTFTAGEYSNPWIRHRASEIKIDYPNVSSWKNIYQEWNYVGTQPWLNADDGNYIWEDETGVGNRMAEFSFADLPYSSSEFKTFNTIELKMKGAFYRNFNTVFSTPCDMDASDFDGTKGTVEFPAEGPGGCNCMKATYDTFNCNEVWKFRPETWNSESRFQVKLPSASGFSAGDQIFLYEVSDNDETGTYLVDVGVKCYEEDGTKKWKWKIVTYEDDRTRAHDLDREAPANTWITVQVSVFSHTWSGKVLFYESESGQGTSEITDCHYSSKVQKCFLWAGYFYSGGNKGTVRFYDMSVGVTCSYFKLKTEIWRESLGIWQPLTTLTFYEDEGNGTTKVLDITSYLTSSSDPYGDFQNLKIRFTLESKSSDEGGGGIILNHVYLRVKTEVWTGEGSPYIGDDDGDEDYVEASQDGQVDFAWQDFGLTITQAASFEEVKIYLKGRNVNGDADATVKVYVWDIDSSVWIDVGTLTWSSGETSYSLKSLDVKSYLNERDKIINTRWKFEKIGSSGTIRITYGYMYVKYIQAASLMTFDTTIKKAGTGSIKLYWGGTIGAGTISAKIWLTPPNEIACQTTECKEGYKYLKFAALIDMGVVSDLGYWRRPEASISTFTVRLYDDLGNAMEYAASDLYPATSFTSFPSPEKKKMKEISISVGENAEANGQWTRLDSNFDWTKIKKIEWRISGETKTDVEGNPYMDFVSLWLDWVHFDGGRWKGRYTLPDNSASVLHYGRKTEEFFDKTAFSDEDCYYQAKYLVRKYKYPTRTLENVEIDYSGMESLKPGEIVSFEIPEGTFSLRIKKITWVWDGDLIGKLDLDNEGFQPEETTCENKLGNPGFETGDWPPWTNSGGAYVNLTNDPSEVHSGSWAAYLHGAEYETPWFAQEITPVEGSKINEFSFWARGLSDGDECYVTIHYSDGSEDSASLTTTTSYTKYDYTSKINKTKKVQSIIFEGGYYGIVYIDDVVLEVCA